MHAYARRPFLIIDFCFLQNMDSKSHRPLALANTKFVN